MLGALVSAYIAATPQHRGKLALVRNALRLVPGTPVRSRYGVLLLCDPADLTNMMALVGGDYDDVFEVVSTLRPGMAFLDIGANAGVFSMIAGKLVGNDGAVVAFEPSLPVFRRLIANASLNDLNNFHAFMAAIGPTTSVARFSRPSSAHTGVGHLDPNGDAQVLQLDGTALAAPLAALTGDRKIMIKVDVEGAEYAVLTSLQDLLASGRVRTVVAEIDPEYLARFNAVPQNIYDLMRDKGFEPRLGIGAANHYNETFSRQTGC